MQLNEFKDKYSIKLNEQQDAAVSATEGAVLLLAVPGSGKTTVLVARLGYMIFARNISPESILTMTYTVAATKDMRKRFASVFGDETAQKINFSTINSVSCQIIRYYEYFLNRTAFRLIDSEQEAGKLIGDIYRQVTGEFAREGDVKGVRSLITYSKNMMLNENEIKELDKECKGFSKIYKKYCDTLLERKEMDFDDQMVYAYKILKSQPEILSYFCNRYKYICVDEAQDTSKIQHMIIRLIAGDNANIFMVGDEDQSIYGFRAAYPDALMDFENTYPNATVLMLETNYRSTGHIVSSADSFIKTNTLRRQKNMTAVNEQGNPIRIHSVKSRVEQYAAVREIIAKNSGQTAILYRDNDSSIPFIDLFDRDGTSFRCRGNDTSFFAHPVVSDIIDICNFAFNMTDDELFMRIYYKFSKGIKKTDALEAVAYSRKRRINILDALLKYCDLPKWCKDKVSELKVYFEFLKKSSAFEGLDSIINEMGYSDYLESRGSDKSKLDILKAIAVNESSIKGFLIRLKELEAVIKNGTDGNGKLVLSTIHSAKGLEYDNVILVDVIDGQFPKIDGNFTSESTKIALEEERRLFYVGITRAKEELVLIKYEEYGYSSMFVSHFVPKQKNKITHIRKKRQMIPDVDLTIFNPGKVVVHTAFGKGVIRKVENDIAEIYFDKKELKKIVLSLAVSNGLMKIVD